jgi:hypothetical protein
LCVPAGQQKRELVAGCVHSERKLSRVREPRKRLTYGLDQDVAAAHKAKDGVRGAKTVEVEHEHTEGPGSGMRVELSLERLRVREPGLSVVERGLPQLRELSFSAPPFHRGRDRESDVIPIGVENAPTFVVDWTRLPQPVNPDRTIGLLMRSDQEDMCCDGRSSTPLLESDEVLVECRMGRDQRPVACQCPRQERRFHLRRKQWNIPRRFRLYDLPGAVRTERVEAC